VEGWTGSPRTAGTTGLLEVRVGLALALVAVLLRGACARAADAPDVAKGKEIYTIRCAPCHGAEGGGDGPAAAMLDPKPRNFRDAQFWKTRTVQQLRLVVKHGRPGTLMAAFDGVLSDAEIDDVVAYLGDTFKPHEH